MKLGFSLVQVQRLVMGCQVEGNLLLIYLDKTLVRFRTAFRHQLQTIDVMSTYATDWLPQGFRKKGFMRLDEVSLRV